MAPRALVITAAGINCDEELAHAFALAGAEPTFLHLNALRAVPARLDDFDLVGLPGGFSYGDAIAAGRVAAQLMRQALYPAFVRAIERGVPIIAPCNGFQMAVQIGILPGAPVGAWPEAPPEPTVTLAVNEQARFVDRWSRIEIPAQTRCVWTRGVEASGDAAMLPSAHGEGRFIPATGDLLQRLEADGQVAVRYAADDDPNGSVGHVAGICDPSGLVFGLMPHPERYTRWTQHPWWTRLARDGEAGRDGDTPGLQMFRRAVDYARGVQASARTGAAADLSPAN